MIPLYYLLLLQPRAAPPPPVDEGGGFSGNFRRRRRTIEELLQRPPLPEQAPEEAAQPTEAELRAERMRKQRKQIQALLLAGALGGL